jgi:DNA-binding transcriptional LysR family regulator
VALAAVTPVLNTLLSDFPDLELQVSEEALSGTWEALLDSRVDVVIGAPGPKPSVAGVQTETICELPGVFAVAAHHPLAASNSIADQAQLAGERWVILRDTARSWVPREVLAFNPPKKLLVGNMGDKIAAQAAGLGVGFLPEHLIRRELANGRLVAPGVSLERVQPALLLAWRSDSRGRGLQQLLKLLRSHFA